MSGAVLDPNEVVCATLSDGGSTWRCFSGRSVGQASDEQGNSYLRRSAFGNTTLHRIYAGHLGWSQQIGAPEHPAVVAALESLQKTANEETTGAPSGMSGVSRLTELRTFIPGESTTINTVASICSQDL
jgi:hypothetical protein